MAQVCAAGGQRPPVGRTAPAEIGKHPGVAPGPGSGYRLERNERCIPPVAPDPAGI